MIGLVVLTVFVALALLPQWYVRRIMACYGLHPLDYAPGSGGELAQHLLRRFGIEAKVVEDARGDFYDPQHMSIHLQPSCFRGRSLTAITVAAHEFGHALQHHQGSRLFALRTRLARLAMLLMPLGPLAFIAGAALLPLNPRMAIWCFVAAVASRVAGVVVHLITLPVELDASFARALPILCEGGYIQPNEYQGARTILRAAALTYLSSALMQLLVMWRWAIFRR